ncbi:hypothetical protein ACIQ9P_22600 [Kitasatospora sp. NPDC094019]|uniref:hypothetical protein n=1 Tax=Kitasatospora sp. NPDC094019 TaxID=3364091 RepID=UPI0038053CE0
MTTEHDEPTGDGSAGTARTFAALPGRTGDDRSTFHRALAAVTRIPGVAAEPEPDTGGTSTWAHGVRRALRAAADGLVLSEDSFQVLLEAAVQDPNPSFNRWFVEPALNAYGYHRVRAAMLDRLRNGTDAQRAGAARAWYWTALPVGDDDGARAEDPGALSLPGATDEAALVGEWRNAALREFVANEDLDVRRCILPGLPLRKSKYPPELHPLVETATSIARTHPDDYIRHRVEVQLGY